jgi:hypothetical protein
VEPDAGSGLDRVLFTGTSGAEPPGGDTDGEGIKPDEDSVGRREDGL